MLRLGIHRLEQLREGALESWLGGRKSISILLYGPAQEVEGEAGTLSDAVLRRFVLANGTFKRTYQGRFQEFDRRVVELLAESVAGRTVRVHDMAVSDGRTSVDLFRQLEAAGVAVDFLATDLVPYVYVYPPGPARLRIVVGPERRLLQVLAPPFVFNVPKRERLWVYPLNHLVLGVLLRTAVPALRRRLEEGGLEQAARIDLVHRSCVSLARETERFRWGRHDLFLAAAEPAEVVRAMNILNPGYFSPAETVRVLDAIARSLVPGGLLVTGSNQGAGTPVEGGVYRLEDGRFVPVFEQLGGSPVRELILRR